MGVIKMHLPVGFNYCNVNVYYDIDERHAEDKKPYKMALGQFTVDLVYPDSHVEKVASLRALRERVGKYLEVKNDMNVWGNHYEKDLYRIYKIIEADPKRLNSRTS